MQQMYQQGIKSREDIFYSSEQDKKMVPVLSDLYIQIPKLQSPRKLDDNYFLPSYQNQELLEKANKPSQNYSTSETPKFADMSLGGKTDSNYFWMSNQVRTKNSSDSLRNYKSESEIIRQWIQGIMEKKQLLGSHWEVNIRMKQFKILRQAFEILKEQSDNGSQYLKTQSKHKPYYGRKQNVLINFGAEKIFQAIKRLVYQRKIDFFTFIKFDNTQKMNIIHMQDNSRYDKNSKAVDKKQLYSPNTLKNEKRQQNFHVNYGEGVRENAKPNIKNSNQYLIQEQGINKIPQSKSHKIFAPNEYSLAPTEITSPHAFKKRQKISMNKIEKEKNKRQMILIQADPVENEKKSIRESEFNSNNSNNVKYEFNQHNYFVVPKTPSLKNLQDINLFQNVQKPFIVPQSPRKNVNENNIIPPQKVSHPVINQLNFADQRITGNSQKNRPATHKPLTYSNSEQNINFVYQRNQKNLLKPINTPQRIRSNFQDNQTNPNKSRAVSFSPNIKFSFTQTNEDRSKNQIKYQLRQKNEAKMPIIINPKVIREYGQQNFHLKHSHDNKIFMKQSAQMRHTYQINSQHHELLQPYQHIKSSPIFQQTQINSVPSSPQTHQDSLSPRSPKGMYLSRLPESKARDNQDYFAKQSFQKNSMPISPRKLIHSGCVDKNQPESVASMFTNVIQKPYNDYNFTQENILVNQLKKSTSPFLRQSNKFLSDPIISEPQKQIRFLNKKSKQKLLVTSKQRK